ncbi:MAG TPA: TonB C-terminal domain-containing protein [Gemmatimonadaceae bacterium]|nr:TonB C-terminal domain-containing protein [Gemmatimonadaceae bacterium]
MPRRRVRERARLAPTLGVSLLMHLAVAVPLIFARPDPEAARPPIYRVDLVAAPPGPRQEGIVTPQPQPQPERPAATPPRAERRPQEMPAPPTTKPPPRTRAQPAPATPTAAPTTTKPAETAPAQPAGGGATGDRGTDVATVRTEGIEFPYPAYLQNIVRQIAKRFDPPRRGALSAEVTFLLRRDGSVADIRISSRSGNFEFDQDAMGAVEAAARAGAFGPLPDGFPDDVLPVIFSFDPRVLR